MSESLEQEYELMVDPLVFKLVSRTLVYSLGSSPSVLSDRMGGGGGGATSEADIFCNGVEILFNGAPILCTIVAVVPHIVQHPELVNVTHPATPDSAVVGDVLTCTTGTWSGSPSGYLYQWKRGGVVIPGATSSTYTATSDDAGSVTLHCTVTATKPGASSSSADSDDVSVSAYPAGAALYNGIPITFNGSYFVP